MGRPCLACGMPNGGDVTHLCPALRQSSTVPVDLGMATSYGCVTCDPRDVEIVNLRAEITRLTAALAQAEIERDGWRENCEALTVTPLNIVCEVCGCLTNGGAPDALVAALARAARLERVVEAARALTEARIKRGRDKGCEDALFDALAALDATQTEEGEQNKG